MNYMNLIGKCFGLLLFIAYFSAILIPVGDAMGANPTVYDLWNHLEEFQESYELQKLLTDKDWVNYEVDSEDLDHILVLTQQLHDQLFPDVPVSLVLAVISAESSFTKDLVGFSDDSGLMQVIPKFHKERIAKYLWDDSVDIFDERVNIATGMDYLSELLELSNGDVALAAMCYNEGPNKAISRYRRGIVSSYAEVVCYRMQEIEKILNNSNGGRAPNGTGKAAC